jgi:hypothetical protein
MNREPEPHKYSVASSQNSDWLDFRRVLIEKQEGRSVAMRGLLLSQRIPVIMKPRFTGVVVVFCR